MTAEPNARLPATPLFAVCLPALLAYALLAWRFDFLCDDAYIAFRYAHNLAAGAGLLYNPGLPPVEGYSNFLWVLVLALGERLGAAPTELARVLSALCGAGLVLHVAACARARLELSDLETAATALFLATLPPVCVWATGGLETMAAAWAVFAAFERASAAPRPAWIAAGVAAAAAALLRVDGLAFACAALVAGAVASRASGAVRAAAASGAMMLAAALAQLLWRHHYYGEWVANTARVKGGLSALHLERGFDYVVAFLLAILSVPLVLAALPAARRVDRRLLCACAIVLAATGAHALLVGGDFMAMGRFFVVALPFLALAFALVLRRLATAAAQSAFAVACILLSLLPAFDVHLVPLAVRARFHFRWSDVYLDEYDKWVEMKQRADGFAAVGRAVARIAQPGDSIVLGPVGAVGYESGLTIYDVYGIVSPDVARLELPPRRATAGHDRMVEPEFFLDRHPTFLAPYVAEPGAESRALLAGWDSNPLARIAVLERHPLPAPAGFPPGTELWMLRVRPEAAPR